MGSSGISAKPAMIRRAAGTVLKAAAVASVLYGVVLFHWAWTTVAIIGGLVLMGAGSRLAPSGRQRRAAQDGGQSPLYARPHVADPNLPRASASWFDSI